MVPMIQRGWTGGSPAEGSLCTDFCRLLARLDRLRFDTTITDGRVRENGETVPWLSRATHGTQLRDIDSHLLLKALTCITCESFFRVVELGS